MRISDWSSDVCSSDLRPPPASRYRSRARRLRPTPRTGSRSRSNSCRSCRYCPTSRSPHRSEEHTSELQSLMRISYAVFCLKKKNNYTHRRYIVRKLVQIRHDPVAYIVTITEMYTTTVH